MFPADEVLGSVVSTKLALIIASTIVTIPAAKLPDASRLTIVLAVSRLVAAFASIVAAATFAAVCPPTMLTTVAPCVPVTSPVSDPVKFVELVAVVAVVALPLKFAVIVPAAKLPDPSRTTISPAMLLLEIVAKLAFVIVAAVISAFTIKELETAPVELLCKTPAVVNGVIVNVLLITSSVTLTTPAEKPPEELRSTIVLGVSALVAALARTVAAATFAALCPPTKLTTVALCVPVTSPLKDPVKLVAFVAVVAVVAEVALPFKLAVIVPAEKLPDESRATIVLAVFPLVAVVAEFATKPDAVSVANLPLAIAAFEAISEFTIKELDKLPDASLWTMPALVNAGIATIPPDEICN
jgi:hypothetical protein